LVGGEAGEMGVFGAYRLIMPIYVSRTALDAPQWLI